MTLAGPLSVRLSLLCTVLLWLGARSNWNIQFSRVLHLFVSAWTEFLLLLCWPSVYAFFIVRCECFVHALLFDIFDLEGSTVNVCTLVCSLSRVLSRERERSEIPVNPFHSSESWREKIITKLITVTYVYLKRGSHLFFFAVASAAKLLNRKS